MLLKSLIFDDIYAPAFEDYSFANYSTSKYLPYITLDQYPGNVFSYIKEECNYYDLINVGKYGACSHGGYKVCILCDPYNYYHVLRQNNDGYWSQYISCEGVCNYDSNFNQIKNPEKCSFAMSELDYSTSSEFHEMDFDLSTFVGFYELFKL